MTIILMKKCCFETHEIEFYNFQQSPCMLTANNNSQVNFFQTFSQDSKFHCFIWIQMKYIQMSINQERHHIGKEPWGTQNMKCSYRRTKVGGIRGKISLKKRVIRCGFPQKWESFCVHKCNIKPKFAPT